MSRPLTILVAYSDLKVGGVQHMTTKLANAWVAAGHKVTIALNKREPELEPYPLDPKVELIDFGGARVRQCLFSLARLLRERQDIDILYSATTVPNIVAVLACKLSRTRARLVISERDNPVKGFAALTARADKLIWRLKPWAYKRADAVVCVSTPLADALAGFTGMQRDRITVVHNPAEPDNDAFLSAPPPHPWLADKAVPVVIAAGRFHPQKDFPMLLRAFAQLRQHRNARLVMLGDGEERPALERLAQELNITDDVLFAGMQKDIMTWLVHGDLFAMSSTFEGFGNVLVQALAAGTPIVSTDCPDGPAEILENGTYGELVPVGDASAMAEAMGRMLDRPRDPDQLRQRASAFSTARIAGRYQELFGALL